MNIGILGSGKVGGRLGQMWARAGHKVIFSSRHPDKLQNLASQAGNGATTGSFEDAARASEVLLLAVIWQGAQETLQGLSEDALRGKILIDATNPYGPPRPPRGSSGGELVAGWASSARVVKAFDMMSEADMGRVLANPPTTPEEALTIFFCGDDDDTKETVAGLIEDAGFAALDIGPLNRAELLEGRLFTSNGPFYGARVTKDEALKLNQRVLASAHRGG